MKKHKSFSSNLFFLILFFPMLLLLPASTFAACTDLDGDGYGSPGDASCPKGSATDCDDTNPKTYPGATRICDGKDNDCDGRLDFSTDVDKDHDGYPMCVSALGADCNDNDSTVYPGAQEGPYGDPTCSDGKDNNCNGKKDSTEPSCSSPCVDKDGDGYGNPGSSYCPKGAATDCNDNNSNINPDKTDTNCNGIDENCSGTADEGYVPTPSTCGVGACVAAGQNICQNGVIVNNCTPGAPQTEGPYGDPTCSDGIDNNCNGQIDTADGYCAADCIDNDGDGYGSNGSPLCQNGTAIDCNDNDPNINPGASDANCNGINEDCDQITDDNYVPTPTTCGVGICAKTGQLACQNGAIVNTCVPGTPQTEGPYSNANCRDNKDNNCNGLTDAADPNCSSVCVDTDGDGYGISGAPCPKGTKIDCDDTDTKVYPGALRICDGKDNDCDGRRDFSTDVDNDHDGAPVCAGDCNDNNPNISPKIKERHYGFPICSDGIDNDCDGKIDANDPGCAVPTCITKTSPKNGPHFFTLLNPDGTVHPNNAALDCGKCHYPTNFKDAIRDQCQRCHADPNDTSDPLNGTLKAQYPLNPPYGYGSAPNVKMHSSTVVGTKYGNWEPGDRGCVTCHNPHTQEQNAVFGTTYGQYIKEYICGLNAQEFVQFTALTGAGSFADGAPHNENVCEMCHARTNHHRRDGTAPGDLNGGTYVGHYDGNNCTNCHPHTGGFKPSIELPPPHNTTEFTSNCNYCHVDGQSYTSPIPDSKCEQCHTPLGALKASFTTAPDVLTHSDINGSGKYTYSFTCVACHDPMHAQTNLKLVRSTLGGSIVPGSNIVFTAFTGVSSFADGAPHNENVCETCHSQTNHHWYNGSAPSDNTNGYTGHSDSENCITCHTHVNGFVHGGGAGTGCDSCHGHDAGYGEFTGGKGTYVSHSTHTEDDADDLKGPHIDCMTCHKAGNFPYFKTGTDSDGDGKISLSETDVCDTCHSPGGAYDGINDTKIGAKNNWANGVYNVNILASGKEKWCAGCHDNSPSIIQGVSAPNVIGDEDAGYGYYKTGHGLPNDETYPFSGAQGAGTGCLDCHSGEKQHIDGVARTYVPDSTYLTYDPVSASYQDGYRLKDVAAGYAGKYPMHIPRTGHVYPPGFREDWEFALCFECHDRNALLGDVSDPRTTTNFRDRRMPKEDFESGNFTKFPWQSGGAGSWSIQIVDSTYAAKAPLIGNSQQSYLQVTLNISVPGNIYFYYKVSSESNDDFLRFEIDGLEQGRWSGELGWQQAKYQVPAAGTHTFKWEYTKGTSGASGSDTAWIDNIVFPDNLSGSAWNSHNLHTDGRNGPLGPETPQYDSNFDGVADSRISCPSCHNVHGSTAPRMFRSGELEARTSPVAGIVPFLGFRYTVPFLDLDSQYPNGEGSPTLLESSGGAGVRFYAPGPGDVSRNGVCNMCHNEYWFNGDENGTYFTGYARTPVLVDTTVPKITSVYAQAGSDTLTVRFSEGVYTDSGALGNLTINDFVLTDLDNGRTVLGVTHTAGDTIAFVTLSSPLDSANDIGTDSISAALNSIFDTSGNAVDTTAVIWGADSEPPTAANLSPQNGLAAAYNSNLTFTLQDSGSGVDWSTFSIQLSGDMGYSKLYTDADVSVVSQTGAANRYNVVVDPDADFQRLETITVTLNVRDRFGNSLVPPAWSFKAASTASPRTLILHPSGLSSNPGEWAVAGDWGTALDANDGNLAAKGSGPGNNIFYVDMDDPTGLSSSAAILGIRINVLARYIEPWPPNPTVSGGVEIGYQTGTQSVWKGSTSTGTSGYTLILSSIYTKNSDGGALDLTDIYNLKLSASRLVSGSSICYIEEVYAEVFYYDAVADIDPPTISNQSPPDGVANISYDSDLTFVLSDSDTGVDWSTFSIQLTGDKGYSKTYTEEDGSVVSKTGTPQEYNVTVNPDTDFGTEEVITVTVNVNDQYGNAMVPPTWSFTSKPASASNVIIHPSGLVWSDNGWPTGGDWGDVMDSDDGDSTYAEAYAYYSMSDGGYPGQFMVDMDDPVGLEGKTIDNLTAIAVLKIDSTDGGVMQLFYDTGGTTVSGDPVIYGSGGTGGAYMQVTIPISTTDPEGGALDLVDLNNLHVRVYNESYANMYGNESSSTAIVTEIYAVIEYH